MFDTRWEIAARLAAGEDARVELQGLRFGDGCISSPNTEDMAGEMTAFANADGGVIFLGVDDRGVVRGVPEDRVGAVEGWVINIASNNCEPPLRPVLRKERLPRPDGSDALVMLVEVRRSLYVHRTSGGRYYFRVGSSKRDLSPRELARLFQQRGRTFVFDEQPVPDASTDALDRRQLERFFDPSPAIPWPDLLRNTRVTCVDDEDTERPTVAGLLAFGAEPQEHMPNAYIAAAVYRGARLDSADLVHSEDIVGSVDAQIDGATAFVERFMLKPATKPAGRLDAPQYPIGAVHEAIVNAVAHRDYSVAGAKIRLFLFEDRLELYSPGSLPNTLTIETMPYRVFTPNQLLVGFLSRMKSRRTGHAFLESRGEGVRRIIDEGARHAGRKPTYELFGQELRLTLWAKPSPHEAAEAEEDG
jgi:predicted HTH transcriptional regulator